MTFSLLLSAQENLMARDTLKRVFSSFFFFLFARKAAVCLRSASLLQLQGLERILSDSKQMNEQSPGEAW